MVAHLLERILLKWILSNVLSSIIQTSDSNLNRFNNNHTSVATAHETAMHHASNTTDNFYDKQILLDDDNDHVDIKSTTENSPPSYDPELMKLFEYIDHYKPKEIIIEPKLKCFIPQYIPAIGTVDSFIKVPRPDNVPDGLGLTVIDEPSMKQSDAAVLELQLRSQMKKKMNRMNYRGFRGSLSTTQYQSIENASKNQYEIDKWIQSVQELHLSKPTQKEVQYKEPNKMPSIEEIMCPFPKELQAEFNIMLETKNEGTKESSCNVLLNPDIDLTLEEYIRAICTLLDVPIIEGHLTHSLYFLFNLCLEFQNVYGDDNISVL